MTFQRSPLDMLEERNPLQIPDQRIDQNNGITYLNREHGSALDAMPEPQGPRPQIISTLTRGTASSPLGLMGVEPSSDKPIEPGNIDLTNRPKVVNPDGSISTVWSMLIGTDEGEVLIPRIGPKGEVWTEEQAIQNYYKTGQHLGIFSSVESANRYTKQLHEQQAKMINPKYADLRPDAKISLKDYSQEDLKTLEALDIRQKASRVKEIFGEKTARFLYGNEAVDLISKQILPKGYEMAYEKDGKWFIPGEGEVAPPPKEFLQSVPEMNLMEKSLTWILPESMVQFEDRVRDLFRGSNYTRTKAMNELSLGALELMALKRLPGETVMGAHSVADLAMVAAGKTLKQMVKIGMVPPRLLLKALAHMDRKLFLPVREQLWEVVTWPLTKPRIVPSYSEGGKTIAEVFQPTVERLAKKGMDKPFREGQAQRQLVSEIGQQIGEQVKFLSPEERLQFGKAMRGEKVSNQKVNDLIRRMKKRTAMLNLDKRYEEHFYNQLEKSIKKLDFGYGLESELPFLQVAAKDLGESLTKRVGVRQTQKVLKQMIEHPLLPNSAKALAKDLHNMPAATPQAVSEAARYAMRHSITDALKQSKMVKTVLGAGDNPKEWMLSKHPLMKGLYVNRDVELELRAMEDIPKMSQRTFNKWFMTPWKTSKVILRPATHFRNMVSNTILNDWGGLPFYRLDIYKDALKQMRGKSPLWKEFKRITGAGGTFSSEEVNQLAAGLKYGSNMYDVGLAAFDKFARPFREMYNAEEQWFKFAKFIHNKSKGMDPIEAAYDAVKWTFNYGEITRSTAFVRGYIAPFYTWQSKVLPLMAETVVKNPWRIGKWYLMYQGLQSSALSQLRISNDEWERFQHVMPEYLSEAQMLLLPWRDSDGRLQMLNLTYMIPGFGDLSEILAHPSGELIGHPLTVLAGEIRTQTKWNGAPLYYDWEDPSTKMMKTFSHVWDAMMPSWAPGSIDWRKMHDSFQHAEGAPNIEQMLASQVGFKIIPINESAARRSRQVIDQIHLSEIGSAMKRELRTERNPDKRKGIIEKYQRLRRNVLGYTE